MKNKKTVTMPISIIVTAVLLLSAIRIYSVNKQYPDPIIVEHSLDEVIKGVNTSLAVNQYELIDGAQLKQLAPEYEEVIKNDDGSELSDKQIRVLLVHLTLFNTTDEPQTMALIHLVAESLIWANGVDNEIYQLLNTNNGNLMGIELEPSQRKEIIIPYAIYHFQFKPKDWINIDSNKFNIVLSQYPTKHIVKLY